jgi:hypothetical protein
MSRTHNRPVELAAQAIVESECQRARHEPFTTTDIVDRKTAIIGLGQAALPGPATDGIALLQSRLVTAGSR